MLTKRDALIVCIDRILLIAALAVLLGGSFVTIPAAVKVAAFIPVAITSTYLTYRGFQLRKQCR